MSKFKSGKLEKDGILKLAENLLKDKKAKEAAILYEEASSPNDILTSINHGTALVISGNVDKGLGKYKGTMATLQSQIGPQKESLLNALRNNVLMALKEQEKQQQQKEKQQQKDEQEQKDKQNSSNEDQGKEGDDKGKTQDQGKENQDKKEEQKDNKGKEKEDKKDKKDKEEDNKDSLEEKEKKIKENREQTKLPAMIKQILDDDRKLQQQYLETSTHKRGQPEELKDW
jgi:hypothetical protein